MPHNSRIAVLLSFSIYVVCSSPANANTNAQNLAESVSQCAKETNALKRLVCFDELAKTVDAFDKQTVKAKAPTVTKVPAAAAITTITPALPAAIVSTPAQKPSTKVKQAAKADIEAQATKEEQEIAEFGLPPSTLKDTELVDGELLSSIVDIRKTNILRYRYTLANGQVWEKTDSNKQGLPRVGNKVVIRSGALGSYFMRKVNTNRSFKVKRISS